MSTPTISKLLDYVRVQMAAEALYYRDSRVNSNMTPGDTSFSPGEIPVEVLTTGNGHASKFTLTDATKFAAEWKVIEHKSNTDSGFSGTLFFNENENKYVLAIRSTEFIDDAARDCAATNNLEIKEKGWAFGQIDDLETWYQTTLKGKIDGAKLDVTGYSLGAHVATAFNLMHQAELNGGEVVTFNGAGVGQIGGADVAAQPNALTCTPLQTMIDDFHTLRTNDNGATRALFTSVKGLALYDEFKGTLESLLNPAITPGLGDVAESDITAMLEKCYAYDPADTSAEEVKDRARLIQALFSIQSVVSENDRVAGLAPTSHTDSLNAQPATIHDGQIGAVSLDYQLAVWQTKTQYNTSSVRTSVINPLTYKLIFGDKKQATTGLFNQYDIVGTEMAGSIEADMVSHSQVHYGTNVPIFIEDQPGYRGSAVMMAAAESFAHGGAKLLLPGYDINDFGDTHSLVLIMDSLSVMNVLGLLDSTTDSAKLAGLFQAASHLKSDIDDGAKGQCEGDVLENILNSLNKIILGKTVPELNGDKDGNTWWREADRAAFYDNLNALTGSQAFKDLKGKVTVTLPDSSLAQAAHTDFASLLTLLTLSPLAITAKAGSETEVASLLQSNWPTEYADWQIDVERIALERAAGNGIPDDLHYSEMFLADRAAMLTWLNLSGTQNTPDKAFSDQAGPGEQWYFKQNADGATEARQVLARSNTNPGDGDAPQHNILFGGNSSADVLTGGALSDHLYGAGGNDTLAGGTGNDYLEGGTGTDTYQLKNDGRLDTLLDADGLGTLRIDDNVVSGTFTRAGDSAFYYSVGKTWRLNKVSDTHWILAQKVADDLRSCFRN